MNEETTKLIRELAEKLGTTGEHLWSVLIEQARIEFISSSIQYAIIIAFIAATYQVLKKASRLLDSNSDESIIWCVVGIGMAVVSILFICMGFDYLSTYFASILNPEFWALKQVLAHVK